MASCSLDYEIPCVQKRSANSETVSFDADVDDRSMGHKQQDLKCVL